MKLRRFQTLSRSYDGLRLAVVGDFCLDRYLEIDPERREISIETGLPVHNVVRVRSQPGGAGTILNNLVALGVKEIYPVGFCGEDGEGWELTRALRGLRGVRLDGFVRTRLRRTFTYCKPLLMESGQAPVELNRLDSKNWTETPEKVQERIIEAVQRLASRVDGFILLDQVDLVNTGVVTTRLLEAIQQLMRTRTSLLVLADSRRGLRGFPPVGFKMNLAELVSMTGLEEGQELSLDEVRARVAALARNHRQPVFVTLAEQGMVGADGRGKVDHVPAHPVRGPIDIVGAGDSVTANLTTALAAGATVREAMEIANAAASIVIHQLGTTGTASLAQIETLLGGKE